MPPRNASAALRVGSRKMSNRARVMTRSCSTSSSSAHGATARQRTMSTCGNTGQSASGSASTTTCQRCVAHGRGITGLARDKGHPVQPPSRELGLEHRQDCLRSGPLEQVPQTLELGRRGLDGERRPHAASAQRRREVPQHRERRCPSRRPSPDTGRGRARRPPGWRPASGPTAWCRSSTGAAAAVRRTTNSITSRPVRTGRRGRAVTTWTTCAAWPEAPWIDAAVRRPT